MNILPNHLGDMKKYDDIIANFNIKNTITDLMNNLFNRVTNLSNLLNNNLNQLLNLSENLANNKVFFTKILDNTNQELKNFILESQEDEEKITSERKRLEELLAHVDSSSLSDMKQSIHNAMQSNEWESYRKYVFCNPPYGIWAYVLKIVVVENAFYFCDYLLKAISTINNNVEIIYDLLNNLSTNEFIIKLRIEQIKKNWSIISENVELAKKQPNFFEDCYGLKSLN